MTAPVHVEYQITMAQMQEARRRRLLSAGTLRDLFAGARRRRSQFRRTTVVLLCLFGGVLLFAAGAAWLGAQVHSVFFMLELLPAAFFVMFVFSLRNAFANYRRRHEGHPMFRQTAAVEIDDRGVRSTRQTCRYELEWPGAVRLTETKNLLMILDTEPRAVIIPKALLTDEQRREVHRLAREHISGTK